VGWVERHDIDIGWDAIEVGHVVGMRGVRFEADVVRCEVALELQIVIDDLLENVFLHRLTGTMRRSSGRISFLIECSHAEAPLGRQPHYF
jgi:hypothetical protein